MKVLKINDIIKNIVPDNYSSFNPEIDKLLIQITSYASDIDMKDVQTNQAWKFKIVDGELQYDVEKINTKIDKDIQDKRRARYQSEVDPLTLEGLLENDSAKIAEAKAIKAQIKLDLPKR